MRKTIGWSVAAAAAAAFTSVGLAATLGVTSAKLGTGTTPVAQCDANGFTQTFTTVGGLVTAVTVNGIADPGCEGGSLSLTLTNAAGSSIGSAGPLSVPADGDVTDNSLLLSSVSPQPSAATVAGIHISIVGP